MRAIRLEMMKVEKGWTLVGLLAGKLENWSVDWELPSVGYSELNLA